MPQAKAAKKALRSSQRRRADNDRWRRQLRKALRATSEAISDGNKQAAELAYHQAQRVIDRAARHHIIHANKAARQKSRIQQAIAKLDPSK